jgi:hypothetical protein
MSRVAKGTSLAACIYEIQYSSVALENRDTRFTADRWHCASLATWVEPVHSVVSGQRRRFDRAFQNEFAMKLGTRSVPDMISTR